MKKMVFGVTVLLMVSVGLFIGCSKTEQPASRTTNEATVVETVKEEAKPQAPIIIDDMADFEFTPGYNVPGTLFQSDFKWHDQDGRMVFLDDVNGKIGLIYLVEVEKRFDFTRGDLVTAVFKVKHSIGKTFDYVSIEKK